MPTPSIKRKRFYQSARWKRAKEAKRIQARGICERCGKAGWEVHHKIPLTDENVDDPAISLGMENLELLCTSCHNAARDEEARKKGYRNDVSFDEEGNVYIGRKGNDHK